MFDPTMPSPKWPSHAFSWKQEIPNYISVKTPEDYFQTAKLLFGFQWEKRIKRELNQEGGMQSNGHYQEDSETYHTQIPENDDSFNHPSMEIKLITRIQFLYDMLQHEPTTDEDKRDFLFRLIDTMEEMFQDIVYQPREADDGN